MKKITILLKSTILVFLLHGTCYAEDWKISQTLSGTDDTRILDSRKDNAGNIYMAGIFKGTLNGHAVKGTTNVYDLFVTKYDDALNLLWFKHIGGKLLDFDINIAVSSQNDVYIFGEFQDSCFFDEDTVLKSAGGFDCFIAKYSSNGDFQWASIVATGTGVQRSQSIDIDQDNNLIVTGFYNNVTTFIDTVFNGTTTNYSFIGKFNNNGNRIWVKNIRQKNTGSRISSVSVFNDGYYFTGYFKDSIIFDVNFKAKSTVNTKNDVFLYKTDFNGNSSWLRRSYGSQDDVTASIAQDDYGNVYFGGYFNSPTFEIDSTTLLKSHTVYNKKAAGGTKDIFLIKFNKTGTLQWINKYGTSGYESPATVIQDNDIIYMAGYYSDTLIVKDDVLLADSNDIFMAMFDLNGNELRACDIVGTSKLLDLAQSVISDNQFVYLSGYFASPSITAGSNTLNNPVTPNNSSFIGKYEKCIAAAFTKQKNISCNGGSDGELTVNGYFGVKPYSFSWNTGSTEASISGLAKGTYTVTVSDALDSSIVKSVEITEPLVISFNEAITNITTCYGSSTGAINIIASGGTSPYQYFWAGDGTSFNSEDQSGLLAGNYSLTIQDANGCQNTKSFEITQPANMTFGTSVVTNIGSAVGEIDLGVTGGTGDFNGFTYIWTGPSGFSSGSRVASGLANNGNYTISVTDDNACVFDTTFFVIDSNDINAWINPLNITNISCKGYSDGKIITTVYQTTGATTYKWSHNPALNDSIASNLTAGTYTVTVYDISDSSVASAEIVEPNNITFSGINMSDTVTCYGYSDGLIDLTLSGGTSPYTYLWSNGRTTQDIFKLTADVYSVTITDKNGCENDTTLTIHQAIPINIKDTVLNTIKCYGDRTGIIELIHLSGGAGSLSYVWNDPASQTTATASELPSGYFVCTVTDQNQCIKLVGVNLTQPDPISITSTVKQITCNNDNDGIISITVIGGTPSFDYEWFKNSSLYSIDKNISSLDAGTYYVVATDNNNCSKTSNSVVIANPSVLTVGAIVDSNVSCNGLATGGASSTVSGGVSPYDYSWSNSDTTASINGLSALTYTVTVTDNNGCEKSASVTLTQPDTLKTSISDTPETTTGANDGAADLTVSGGTSPYEFAWSNSQTTEDISGLSANTYIVTVTDNNDCEKVDSVLIDLLSDISSIASMQSVSISPIPASSFITIKASFSDNEKVTVTMLNIQSVAVIQEVVEADNTVELTWDISALPAGSYTLVIEKGKALLTRKILIVK